MVEALAETDPRTIGRYRLEGRLGAGGMGRVFLGRSPGGRAVAVKVVHPELAADDGFRRRFAVEVESARRVGGFHTTPVVDADPEGDPPWLVTAYIAGPSLSQVLAAHGALPEGSLRVLGAGLAEALEAIHGAGLVHRDLKPSNILLADDGPRVIDFGIARAMDATAYTRSGAAIGTPGFMAPEQIRAEAVGPPADVFSFGGVLCQAAGILPFGEGPTHAMLYRVIHEEPMLDGVPDGLRELVTACLAKDPSRRPSPADLLAALAQDAPAHGHATAWLPEAVADMLTRHVPPPPVVPPSLRALSGPRGLPAPAASTDGGNRAGTLPQHGVRTDGGGGFPVGTPVEGGPGPTPHAGGQEVPGGPPVAVVRFEGRKIGLGVELVGTILRRVIGVALMVLGAVIAAGEGSSGAPVVIFVLIGMAMVLGGLRRLFSLFAAVTRPYELYVGTSGIDLRYGGQRMLFGWHEINRVAVRRLAGRGPWALCLYPFAGTPLPSETDRATLPFLEKKTGWIVVTTTRRLAHPRTEVERAVAHFSGPRWGGNA
ncbi:serine/threonine-protein kinase [Thermomonospora umbrina]|uniref:Serine/threonine protein kinase n=1 Tax=Thermomonospora umbrina TaxID=111806 RepID=A0A3D9SN52_9ACTN|nr:serine/threonine-protein kinase [Thermomonospora umbrina]REE97288.1 serine/threonine protein kinase [Thermomonospora umbrina]